MWWNDASIPLRGKDSLASLTQSPVEHAIRDHLWDVRRGGEGDDLFREGGGGGGRGDFGLLLKRGRIVGARGDGHRAGRTRVHLVVLIDAWFPRCQ